MSINPSADTRARLLAAAAKRLQRAPLSELTLSGVARTAGVSRQTVYQHFSDREDLVVSVFIDYAERNFAPKRERAISGALDGEALERVFWVDVDAAREFFTDPDAADPSIRPAIAQFVLGSERMRAYTRDLWIPVLEKFAAAGTLRAAVDPATAARWLSYQQTWLVAYPQALSSDPGEVRRLVREFALEPLLAGR